MMCDFLENVYSFPPYGRGGHVFLLAGDLLGLDRVAHSAGGLVGDVPGFTLLWFLFLKVALTALVS